MSSLLNAEAIYFERLDKNVAEIVILRVTLLTIDDNISCYIVNKLNDGRCKTRLKIHH